MSGNKWIWGLAFFLLGACVGAIGTHYYERHKLMRAFEGGHGPTPDNILRHIDENVGLTEDQKNQIKPILKEMMGKVDVLTSETRPKLDAMFDQTDARIRALLDPDQQKKFDAFMERIRKFRPRGPGGPGGPEGPMPPPDGPGGPPPGGPQG